MAKILVIDDSLVDRQIVTTCLQTAKYSTIEAEDGEIGEAKAKSEKPDLIILDVVMPKKNGFEVCRSLKNDPSTKSIPIILLTSKNQDSDRFWGMKQGAQEYLIKPFNEQDFLTTIKKYIS